VVFDDVDMGMAIHRLFTGDESGERIPMPCVIRKANEKTVAQIGAEIKAAQTLSLEPGQQRLDPEGHTPPPWVRSRAGTGPEKR
jgi:hypothetical protein